MGKMANVNNSARGSLASALLIFVLLPIAPQSWAAEVENCEVRVQLGISPSPGSRDWNIDVRDFVSNDRIPLEQNGAFGTIKTAEPPSNALYRTIIVDAKAGPNDGSDIVGEIAYFSVWPCRPAATIVMATAERTGEASEVRQLREEYGSSVPGDLSTAAKYLADALSTAEARRRLFPNSTHQWNIIATYHALRAFYQYSTLAPVPLTYGSRLAKISEWHRSLLPRVKPDGIGYILDESKTVLISRMPRSRMYGAVWEEIKEYKTSRPTHARQLIARFRSSLDMEPDKVGIMKDIGVDTLELQRSESEITARAIQSNDPVAARMALEWAASTASSSRSLAKIVQDAAARSRLIQDAGFVESLAKRSAAD